MTAARSLSPVYTLPALLGAGVGIAAATRPLLLLLGVAAAGVGLVTLLFPTSIVGLMFTAVLFDQLGVTGMNLDEFPITASKLSVLGGLGVWTVRAALGGGPLVRWHPVLSAMLGVVAVTAISVAIHNSLSVGKFTLAGLAMVTVLVGFVYTVLAEAPLHNLYRALAAILVGVCLLSLAPASGGRSSGTLGDPNEWATMVLLLTPTLLGGLAEDRLSLARLLRVSLLLLAPLVILRTGSRSAFVVGLVVFPGCVYLLRRRRAELAAGLSLAAVATPFAIGLSATLERMQKLADNLTGAAVLPDTSLEERSELFRQAVDLFREHWLLGTGPGTFARASGFLSDYGRFRPAHNSYLEVLCEQGIVGLVPFAILGAVVVRTLWRGHRAAPDAASRSRVLGVSFGLVAVVLMAGTLGLLTFSMAYLVLGLALVVATQAEGNHDRHP